MTEPSSPELVKIWRAGVCRALRTMLNADLLVLVVELQAIESLGGAQQSDAAARNDAFFNGCAGCVQRVVDAVLALLDFDFAWRRRP